MLHTSQLTGIILKKTTLRERDLLIVVFSRELGKVTLIGKGARSATSRRGAQLQSGSYVQIVYTRSTGGLYIKETILKSAMYEIKKDQEKLTLLIRALFMLDRLLPADTAEPEIYSLFTRFCRDLGASTTSLQAWEHLTTFANTTLILLGFEEATDLSWSEVKAAIEKVIEERMP